MKRHEALRHSVNVFKKHLVTCYLGSAAEELYASGDEPRFFYVLGSMGVASSLGLGVALASGHAVLAFEGDGSLLMNLGSLVTIAHQAPADFVLALVDNHQHAATGGQPTATASGLDLAELARAAGFRSIAVCRTLDEIGRAAQTSRYPLFMHLVVQPGDGPRRIVDLEPSALVARFKGARGRS